MSDKSDLGFGKFVPGFDFLQNLAKGASQSMPQMSSLSNWVAPTLNVEELEKRIGDLKAVHFWLDQNTKVLGATIQALEVQKMTLATLKGMNFNMGEVANALKLNAADAAAAREPKPEPQASEPAPRKAAAPAAAKKAESQPATGIVDPLQWWGALSTQFQQIAANAMKDAATHTTAETPKQAPKSAGPAAKKSAPKRSAKKAGH